MKLPVIQSISSSALSTFAASMRAKNVRVNWDFRGDAVLVQFSPFNLERKIYNEKFNGMIVEYPSQTIIVNPDKLAVEAPEDPGVLTALVARCKKVYVHEIVDGTNINLYFYDGKWNMSSINGIRINDNSCGDLTFEQMFDEALAVHGHSYEKLVEMLDDTKSYSFGFSHKNIHHQATGFASVWLGESNVIKIAGIARLPVVDVKREDVVGLYTACDAAKPSDNLYGYLINVVGHGRFILKSYVFKQIQQFIHSAGIWRRIGTKDRKIWFALNAWVSGEDVAALYAELFPEGKKIIDALDAFEEYLFVTPGDALLLELTKGVTDTGDVRIMLRGKEDIEYTYKLFAESQFGKAVAT